MRFFLLKISIPSHIAVLSAMRLSHSVVKVRVRNKYSLTAKEWKGEIKRNALCGMP